MSKANRGWWIVVGWLAGVGLAQAAMYKWVDENGVTQYSQYKPQGKDAEVMVPPPPPAEDPEGAQQQLETTLQKQAEQDKAEATAEDEQAKSEERTKLIEKNCQTARDNLAKLTAGGRKRIVGPDGVATYLTEEDHQAKIAEAEQNIEKYCTE